MRANEKGLELACHLSPDVPRAVIGDPNRLHQILVNLISNAIKFTDSGSVTVRVMQDPELPTPGAIRFSISDTGIGIPSDKLAAIFESFTQAHASITRKYGGTRFRPDYFKAISRAYERTNLGGEYSRRRQHVSLLRAARCAIQLDTHTRQRHGQSSRGQNPRG